MTLSLRIKGFDDLARCGVASIFGDARLRLEFALLEDLFNSNAYRYDFVQAIDRQKEVKEKTQNMSMSDAF